ncbi:MAG: restriction endonuclease subunit S, partial [bacterium]
MTYYKGKKPLIMSTKNKTGYIPYLSAEYLRTNTPQIFVYPDENNIIINEGDLILIWDGSNAGEFFYAKKGVLSSTMAKLELKNNNVDKKFLFYLLKINEYLIKNQTKGTGIPHVDKNVLENILITFPSLEEQIASILSTIDEAIQKTDELIAKTERLKKGMMNELLTKGIGHKEFKDTEIGRIPKEWEIKKINELFEVVTGTTPSTKLSYYWDNGTIVWITPADMSKLNGRLYINDSERKITERALREVNLTLMPVGSIILSTRAPVGYVAITAIPATFNQGCKGLIPKNKQLVPEFFAYYLARKKPFLESLSGGSTFKELSRDALELILVPLPPISEQQQIASILSAVDDKLEL